VDVLHANRPPGWANFTEVLDKVDKEEDAPDITEEQRALVASYVRINLDIIVSGLSVCMHVGQVVCGLERF
jgi:hypothetical protein